MLKLDYMNRLILLNLLILVLLASCVKEEKDITPTPSTQKWTGNRFPLNVKISDEFNTSEITNLRSMATQWETAVDDEVNFFTTTDSTVITHASMDAYGHDNEFGVYKTYVPMAGLPSGALAVTQTWGYAAGGFIDMTHADIIVNYFDFGFSDDFTFGTYDLPTVVLHELGHFLGLDHVSDYSIDSVMHPSISSLTVARTTFDIDKTNIKNHYGISSASSAVIGSSMAMGGPPIPDGPVRIIFELRPDGSCTHTVNGKKHHSHLIDLSGQK
jgi:hypothetical protein